MKYLRIIGIQNDILPINLHNEYESAFVSYFVRVHAPSESHWYPANDPEPPLMLETKMEVNIL